MSEILIDTSVWIEFFHHPNSSAGAMTDLLLGEGRVCTTPLVMVEVISGAGNRAEFKRLQTDFKALPRVEPSVTVWEEMIETRWQLKMRGVSGVSIPDLLIALTASAHEKVLFTLDKVFWRMKPILNLKLIEL